MSLFLHFTVNPKPRVDFIDRPRCCLRGKECSITRFGQVESRWGYSGTSDRIRWAENSCFECIYFFINPSLLRVYLICILSLFFFFRFSVNRRIFVVGFGLYGSIHGPTDYQVNIQVWVRTFTRVSCLFVARFSIYFVGRLRWDCGWFGLCCRCRSSTRTVTRCWARMIQDSAAMGQPTPSESCSKSQWRYYQTWTTLPVLHWRCVSVWVSERASDRSITSTAQVWLLQLN